MKCSHKDPKHNSYAITKVYNGLPNRDEDLCSILYQLQLHPGSIVGR